MTTGQPIKVPSDRNKYNNEFMASLRLQVKLNEQNLQANRLYQATGQLPAATQMMDTRSNQEKLMDVEYLKREIVADLKPIAEPMFANAVIQGVISSPLNVNNSLFRYLAQNASTFSQTLSKKYKFGIAGDANDVAIMVQFLEDAYKKTQNTFQSIKSYINSNTNEGIRSTSSLLSEDDTDNIITELKNIIKRIDYSQAYILDPNRPVNPAERPNAFLRVAGDFKSFLARIVSFLPNSQQMSNIIERINRDAGLVGPMAPGQIRGGPDQPQIVYAVFKILKALPKLSSIQTIADKIFKGLQKSDWGYTTESIEALRNLFASFMSPENMGILQRFTNDYLNAATMEIQQQARVNQVNQVQAIRDEDAAARNVAKAQRVYVINPTTDPANVQDINNIPVPGGAPGGGPPVLAIPPPPARAPPRAPSPPPRSSSSSSSSSSSAQLPPQRAAAGQLDQAGWRVYVDQHIDALSNVELDALFRGIPNNPNLRNIEPLAYRFNAPNPTRQEKEDLCKMALILNFGNARYGPHAGVGNILAQPALGLGIRKKGRGISSDYRDFGINKINHKKLDEGILTIRRKSNNNIPDMPSKKISSRLQKIIKHISGGGMPAFNELQNLEDHEKDYLHKLISRSNLSDRLSVPAPSKDQEEKDFHQFEVMKGEILSGNDSQELIKKFKVLILKLSKQNVLPKSEVHELLQDLLALGY